MRIIELIAGLPEYVKCIGKFTLNAPFAFNSLNGLRRLCMGHGKGLGSEVGIWGGLCSTWYHGYFNNCSVLM